MELDFRALDKRIRYKILTGTVVPRPIAWVSTVDKVGITNLAPFSFFNVVCQDPPTISISILRQTSGKFQLKDTLQNILTSGEFVVNIADETLVSAMNESATDYPAEIDELAIVGLTAVPGSIVRAPRVAEAPVSMECRLTGQLPVGKDATLVLGEVILMHIRDEIIDERYRIDIQKLRPIGRLAGSDYAYVHETFSIDRGRYDAATGMIIPIKDV
jgi:flavin reductase (DIM6/NTAB) family NADH-FMN oxidoreductase RutF